MSNPLDSPALAQFVDHTLLKPEATAADVRALVAEGVRLLAENGTRVIVRPSGTEPKVKSYLEVIVPVAADATDAEITTARTTAHARLDAVRADMVTALGL
jgi:phosphomannomutase